MDSDRHAWSERGSRVPGRRPDRDPDLERTVGRRGHAERRLYARVRRSHGGHGGSVSSRQRAGDESDPDSGHGRIVRDRGHGVRVRSPGSAPTGIHIVRVQHSHLNPEAGTVINLQFPSSGNLIIAGGPTGAADEASGVVSSIDSSPSNAWVQVPGSPLSNGGGGTTLMWYAAD